MFILLLLDEASPLLTDTPNDSKRKISVTIEGREYNQYSPNIRGRTRIMSGTKIRSTTVSTNGI